MYNKQKSAIDENVCKIYANLNVYKNRLERTEKNIIEMLKISNKPYIAFSCGKDSSVLADMVLSIDRSIPLRFISSGETRIIHNVDTIIDYFVAKYNANVQEIKYDRVWSEEWKNKSFDEQRKAGRRDIQNIDNTNFDGVFMGLRKEESKNRSYSLSVHRTTDCPPNMYKYANREFYRMCPLADWKTEDIGAYTVSKKMPVLNWYKTYGFESRTTARLTGDAIRGNTIAYIKMNNPKGYNMLIKRFPELKIYA